MGPGAQAGDSCLMQAPPTGHLAQDPPGLAEPLRAPLQFVAHPHQALPSFSPVTGLRPALQPEVLTISPAPLYLSKPPAPSTSLAH